MQNPSRFKRLYHGFLREAYIYSSYLVKQKRNPNKKFFIFGNPRSGTALLVDLLNSHPQIFCESEILLYRVLFPKPYLQCRSRLSKEDVYGFKFLTSHFKHQKIDEPENFITYLHDQGYQIIALSRRNNLRATLSLEYAIFRGTYHQKNSVEQLDYPRMYLEPEELSEKLLWMENLASIQRRIIAKLPHQKIIYEDDLMDNSQHQRTIDSIADYLNIPHTEVKSDLVKIGKQNIFEFLKNADEIQEYILSTPFKKYLDE